MPGTDEEARRRNLSNAVFLPPQPKESMPKVWSLCDLALVHLEDTPAFGTVIPSKIFEAMGMGLPVLIASPRGGRGCSKGKILTGGEGDIWHILSTSR